MSFYDTCIIHFVPYMYSYLGLEVMPNRVGLQRKRVIRCKRDLELNKPNILVQQKPLPLEGDSSMKVYRGKWWVKDSSAIHFVPSLLLTRLPTAQELIELANLPPELQPISGSKKSKNSDTLPGCRLEFSVSNPRDVPMTVSIQSLSSIPEQNLSSSGNSSTMTKDSNFAPFHCATVPLITTINDTAAAAVNTPSVTVSLAAYEDELLRDAEDDIDEETIISKAFESQLNANKNDSSPSSPDDMWLTASLHNTARISIPLQRINLDHYAKSIMKSGDTTNSNNSKIICTLSLRLIMNVESTSGSSGETFTVDLVIAIPIQW